MISLLLVASLLQPMTVPEAEAALRAEPERPGLVLALAHARLRAGDAAGAEREARAVLARWPSSVQPHLILAGVAMSRGDLPAARRALERVAERAPAPLARVAAQALRRLERRTSGWSATGRLGVAYDTHAVPPALALDPQGQAAARALIGAGAGWQRAHGPWRLRLGGQVDRTVHLADVGEQDRALLRLDARGSRALGPGRLTLRLEGRGGLAGRAGDAHHAGGGGAVWYGRRASTFSPWVQLRGLGFALREAEGGSAWIGAGALGVTSHHAQWRLTTRLAATEVRHTTAGYTELSAEVGVDLLAGPWVLGLWGGSGARDGFDDLRPRGRFEARWRLDDTWHLRAHGTWRAGDDWQRLVTGLMVEVHR